MTKYRPRHPAIENALSLDGDPDTIKAYYAKWAESYDNDVFDHYTGPIVTVELLTDFLTNIQSSSSLDKAELTIADIGCGTGLVGTALNKFGYRNFDGMDISQEMVDKARKLEIYRRLYGDVDMTQPLRPEWFAAYDAVLCCGVFTLGHVPASMLARLMEMVKPNGLAIISTRTSYYDSTDYQQVSDDLETHGAAKLLKLFRDAPYTNDGDAHYWIYQVLEIP